MDTKDPYARLARILRTKPEQLSDLARKMEGLTGQVGVVEDIVRQNDIVIEQTLNGLGLAKTDSANAIQTALISRLIFLDQHLFQMLDKPDLQDAEASCAKLCEVVKRVYDPGKGLFLKQEKAVEFLEKYPPKNLLDHFGYATSAELLEKEGFESVMASLRFTQTTEWMHEFFECCYSNLTPDDFEEREVKPLILDVKWLDVAEKFLKKKYHNVSHLKEWGVIFIIPLKIDSPGEMLRIFTLILHYMHEVPYYSGLFRRHLHAPDFTDKMKSLLRGDVPAGPMPNHNTATWRVVQRYLAKDNADDFRLFEPHVSPEAVHWIRAEEDLSRLARILGKDDGQLDIGWWKGLDFIGDYFPGSEGRDVLVSFDLIDLLMTLVQQDQVKYLYHQQEALWNKIFAEYMGRERMDQLIADHIFDGFITLK